MRNPKTGLHILLIMCVRFYLFTDAQASVRTPIQQIQQSFAHVSSVCWRGAFSSIDMTLVPGNEHVSVTHARHSGITIARCPDVLSGMYPDGDVLNIAASTAVGYHQIAMTADVALCMNEAVSADVHVCNPHRLTLAEPWWVSGDNYVTIDQLCGSDKDPPTLLLSGRAQVIITDLCAPSLHVYMGDGSALQILKCSSGTPKIMGEVTGFGALSLPFIDDAFDLRACNLRGATHMHHVWRDYSDDDDFRT